MDQPEHRPLFLVLTETPRVGTHRCLDAAHVTAELVALRHRCHELPGIVACRSQMSWDWRASREIWRSRWSEPKAGVDLGGAPTTGVPARSAGGCGGPGPPTHGSGPMGS